MTSDRTIPRQTLAIPDRPYAGSVPFDARDPEASFPPIAPVLPPVGAPNVLIILLDDVGFAVAGDRCPALVVDAVVAEQGALGQTLPPTPGDT